jgi:hypothetical protein
VQLAVRERTRSGDLGTALLGSDHPLICASRMLQAVIRQSVIVMAVLVGGIILHLEGCGWAWPLILGAAINLSILALLIAGFQQSKRDHAIELILNGYQNFPIAVIQGQRRRLLSSRTRRSLARSFERMIDQVATWPTLQPRRAPAFHPVAVAEAAEDLLAVARALEVECVSAQGVARAERLITDETSPLYGHDLTAFRAELRRVRHDLLSD